MTRTRPPTAPSTRRKFARVLPLWGDLHLSRPAVPFYLWADVGGDDERFTRG
jgi:hypothetical protein